MFKVLFIRSNPVDPDPRVEKEAITLSKNGYNIEVLAWDRHCKSLEGENKGSYKIRRFRLKSSFGKSELILKLIVWSIYELIYLFKSDCNVIHACDFDTLIPAVIVSKIKNKSLIYDSFDFYADSLPNKTPAIIRKIIAETEIFFTRFADYVILADDYRRKQYKNKLKRVIIINNTPFETSISHKEKKKEIIVFYAGVIYDGRGINKMIEAIKDIENIKLIIAGYGADENNLVEKIKNTENCVFLGKINYDEVIRMTLESDILFALYDPSIPNHEYSSPNKLFEAMMCKKPIIVTQGTSMAKIVKEENCGIIVNYGDVEELKNALIKLQKDPLLRRELGENGRNAYENKYNWTIMENRLLNVYELIKDKFNSNA